MSTTAAAIAGSLNQLLEADRFKDYGPNGVQVEGEQLITTIATAATASLAAIHATAEAGAQALLVHHGILWGRTGPITGMLGQRVRALMQADISLLGYHLPLDAHPVHGNNAWIIRELGLTRNDDTFGKAGGADIGLIGTVSQAMAVDELASQLSTLLNHEVIHCPGGPSEIHRIGVVTGGGQNFLADAASANCDVIITGETSEQTWHEAQELGIHCLAAGHHATECKAIHELGTLIAKEFKLNHQALDLPNPL